MTNINQIIRSKEEARRELRNAIIADGWDEWRRRNLTRAQVEDICDRIVASNRVSVDPKGVLQGSDINLIVDELSDDPANKHLFRNLDAPAEEPKPDLPSKLNSMSVEQRLQYANEQYFADKRRRGEPV